MCGRISLGTSLELIAGYFGLARPPLVEPRWNISPGQSVLAIRCAREAEPEAVSLRWGLIPPWAKEKTVGYKMINARSETIAEKPSFRSAYQTRRCLLVADGFYEWQRRGKQKQPFHVRSRENRLLAIAGIWETWRDPESLETIESCAVITTSANSLMAQIHHRMPVLIPPEEMSAWLTGPVDDLAGLLESRTWPGFEAVPVSTYVNNARNEGPECVQSVGSTI